MSDDAYLVLTLNLTEPIEVNDFGKMFESLGLEFNESPAVNNPDLIGQASIYVKEIRQGSIIVDIIPWIKGAIGIMQNVKVISDFSNIISSRVKPMLSGKSAGLKSKSELNAVANLVRAVANDQNGNAQLESISYHQGVLSRKLELKFNTREARTALTTVESELLLIGQTVGVQHNRVTMSFVRGSVVTAAVGKRSGELVVIEAISKKSLPLIYSSELAEVEIKHHIKESDDNVFRKIFVVDVDVEMRGEREIAYRVTGLHQVFDMPEE